MDERSARSFLGLSPGAQSAPVTSQLEYSFSLARAFARQANFELAREILGAGYFDWSKSALPAIHRGPVLISCCASLQSLSLVAEACCRGWSLLIEDCPFSRLFIKPVAEREREDVEFVGHSAIAERVRYLSGLSRERFLLIVTFCDRPKNASAWDVDVAIGGLSFELSVVDALLHFSRWERLFVFGSALRELPPLPFAEGEKEMVSGQTLVERTAAVATAIEEALFTRAGCYLGTAYLATRCAKFTALEEASARSMTRSFLIHAQLHGFAIEVNAYQDLLRRLETSGLPRTVS